MIRTLPGFALTLVTAATLACGATDVVSLPCGDPVPLTIGFPVAGHIEANECNPAGKGPTDLYTFSLVDGATIKFTVTGGLGTKGRFTVHAADLPALQSEIYDVSFNHPHYAILHMGGTYVVAIDGDGGDGPYQLTSEVVGVPSGCVSGGVSTGPQVFIEPGIYRTASFTADDCTGSANNYFDHYYMYMYAGKSYDIHAYSNTTGLGTGIEIEKPDGTGGSTLLASSYNPLGGAHLVAHPTVDGMYLVGVVQTTGKMLGVYSLQVSEPQ